MIEKIGAVGRVIVVASVVALTYLSMPGLASAELVPLTDEELDSVTAGFIDNSQVNNFVYTYDYIFDFQPGEHQQLNFLQGNAASDLGLGIGADAFQAAQGIFTTVQAVNSAVDIDLFVNIYLNGVPGLTGIADLGR